MKTKKTGAQQVRAYKLGVNPTEEARKPLKLDHNFAQSRDVHQDRGRRQMNLVHNPHTIPVPRGKMKK